MLRIGRGFRGTSGSCGNISAQSATSVLSAIQCEALVSIVSVAPTFWLTPKVGVPTFYVGTLSLDASFNAFDGRYPLPLSPLLRSGSVSGLSSRISTNYESASLYEYTNYEFLLKIYLYIRT